MPETRGSELVVLGWMKNGVSSITHYYKTRKGYKLAVAACGKVAMPKNLIAPTDEFRCANCVIKQELETND